MKSIRYWAFCGNEGTGKTVLSKSFSDIINGYWTYEPNGETFLLKTLRMSALTRDPEMTVMGREMLLLANRSIHHAGLVDKIINNGGSVVTDRSFFSGMVYAKLNGIPFEKWFDMYLMSGIKNIPDALIFVKNKNQNIDKEEDNIYDHASLSTLKKIDLIYKEGLDFIREYKSTKHIQIIEFNNSFDRSVSENVDILISEIKKKLNLSDNSL